MLVGMELARLMNPNRKRRRTDVNCMVVDLFHKDEQKMKH